VNPQIFGIGVDIVEIARIRGGLQRFGERFAQRILTDEEFQEFHDSRLPAHFVARRFAAKEAVAKALGSGFRAGVALRSIGVGHDAYGKPLVIYQGPALDTVRRLGIGASLLSISDERNYALAFAVLLRADRRED
jgi:holo-[acyl-carrier protein] synthase